MLTDRVIKAFTFRREVYAEVEADKSFTNTAWVLVALVAFLNQLGSSASANLANWLSNTVVGTIFAVLGFAAAAIIINWVGKTFFNADVTFDELVRTMGLAYVWNVVGVIGAVSAFSTALACVLSPAIILAVIMLIASWFVAVREALDLDWGQTVLTVILGWVGWMVIMFIAGMVRGLLGLTASGVMGLFGS